MKGNTPPYILAIVGATGTGKSRFAIQIARELENNGISSSIINMDSRQIYSAFPIVSAQPSAEDMATIPHLLYGYASTAESIKAGSYARTVQTICTECIEHGRIPILVGGTGMYFYTFFNGIAPIPSIQDAILQEQREKVSHNIADAYKELCSIDATYAQVITIGDSQKICRALSVYYETGIPLSIWHEKTSSYTSLPYTMLWMDMPMKTLAPLLQKRIQQMVVNGAIDEIRKACLGSYSITEHGWSCIGARELEQYITGTISYEESIVLWYSNTRAYAKRQRTWFRNKHTNTVYVENTAGVVEDTVVINSVQEIIAKINSLS